MQFALRIDGQPAISVNTIDAGPALRRFVRDNECTAVHLDTHTRYVTASDTKRPNVTYVLTPENWYSHRTALGPPGAIASISSCIGLTLPRHVRSDQVVADIVAIAGKV